MTRWLCSWTSTATKWRIFGTPGEGFGACGEGYFRFSTFGSPEDTQEAAKRLVHLLEK